jgi:hypothetical protein
VRLLKTGGPQAQNVTQMRKAISDEIQLHVMGIYMKPSQNSLFKADTRVRSIAENGILGLVHVFPPVLGAGSSGLLARGKGLSLFPNALWFFEVSARVD